MQRYATAVFFAAMAFGVLLCRGLPVVLWGLAALLTAGTGIFLYFSKGSKSLGTGSGVGLALVLAVFFAGGWRGGLYFSRMDAVQEALPWYRPVEYTARVSQVPSYGGKQVRYVQLDEFCAGRQGCLPREYAWTMAVPLSDTLEVDDRVEGRAVLLPLQGALWAGEPDFRSIQRHKGVVGQLRDAGYRVVGREEFSGSALREAVRGAVREALMRGGVSRSAAELTLAVLLGDKGAIDPQTKKAYQLSGAMHLLVVSGLHVGIVAGIVLALTFFLKRRRGLRTAVVLALLWGYGFLTGYSPPILRALWMFSVLLLSRLGKGRYFSLGALCLAGWVDLVLRPQDIYSAGFQMSYAATAAVILSYGPIARVSRGWKAGWRFTGRLLGVTLAAQLALLPFILYYFDYLNLLFPVANLLLVPLVSYGVIPIGGLLTVLSCAGLQVPWLAGVYNVLTDFCTRVASEISQRDFFAVSGVGLSLGGALLVGALCAGVFVWRRSRRWALALALWGGVAFCVEYLCARPVYPFVGKKDGGYVLAVDEERQVKLERGTVVRVGDWTIRAFPRRGECTSGDEEILLVREFAEPERPPAGIVLAGDAWWEDAFWWREYARKWNVPLYDMRERGYFRCGERWKASEGMRK